MAGQPLKRQLLTQIQLYGGVDKIVDEVASGATLCSVAKTLGVTRTFLSQTLNKDPDTNRRLLEARKLAAAAWADQTLEIADSNTVDDERVAKLRIDTGRWMAGRADPGEYGDQKGPTVLISLNAQHLQALQIVEATAARTVPGTHRADAALVPETSPPSACPGLPGPAGRSPRPRRTGRRSGCRCPDAANSAANRSRCIQVTH
ncbi:MAG: hypothetical protein ABFE08_08970 [Armatimonadia bacterium]